MFTGIIEETAKLRSLGEQDMWLDVSFATELVKGQSVACDGVCLTVVEFDSAAFRVEMLEETMKLTAFEDKQAGDLINVERAMRLNDRLDGHIVQAHSEGVGVVNSIDQELCDSVQGKKEEGKEKETWLLHVSVPRELLKYMILKGIIVLNGIALTLTAVDDDRAEIEVAIIPHTWEITNLHTLKQGDKVNIETDILAKYIERLV